MTDTQQDGIAIIDNESPVQNSTIDDNAEIINIPIPQQASGSQNGIMYLMYPSLFDFLDNVLSVKQQPKANNRSRYECDGRRFLPDSRYHPMAINVCFLFFFYKISTCIVFCSCQIYDQLY